MIARGKVYLDGKQFTTDPKIQRNWSPRQSVLPGIGGTVTIQDFGRWAKDMVLTLTSGGNFMGAELKTQIDVLMMTRGATYTYTDYEGLEATVKILDFQPQATFIRDRALVLYEYTLILQIVTLTKLAGATYTGD